MNPELLNYISSAQARGMDREQITAQLLASGWQQAAIDEAFNNPTGSPSMPPGVMVSQPLTGKNKKRPLFIGLGVLGVLLLSGSGVILAAEQGFLPAVSQLYRKTNLPVSWKGMSGNPEVAAFQILEAFPDGKERTATSEITLTLSSIDSTKSAILPSFLTPGSQTRVFANRPIVTEDQEVSNSFISNEVLPITIKVKNTTQADAQSDYYSKLEIQAADLLKIELIKMFFPELPQTILFEARTDRNNSKAYLKTNAFPYLNPKDEGKWLTETMDAEEIDRYLSKENLTQNLSKEDQEMLQEILRIVVSDQGVERLNGEAVSHYRITINEETTRKAEDLLRKKYPEQPPTAIYNATGQHDIWVGQRDHIIRKLEGTTSIKYEEGNMTFQLRNSFTSTKTTTPLPAIPSSDQVIPQTASEYWMEAFQKTTSPEIEQQQSSARNKSHNAIRKSEITEPGKAMEVYLYSDTNPAGPISTANKVIRLDSTNNALLKNADFSFIYPRLPLKDPVPDKYYYTYQSDGKSYEFTSFLTDDTDPNKVTGKFFVKDGTTGQRSN